MMFLLTYQLVLERVCFQCLPQAFDLLLRRSGSVVLVVCPLIAIMEDQVKDAVRRGLLAAYISCDTAPQTKRSIIEGCYQLVFIGSEMLLSKEWKNVLLHSECFQTKLVTVVFDEAHCISKWYVTTIMLQFLYNNYYTHFFHNLGVIHLGMTCSGLVKLEALYLQMFQ